MDYIQKYKIQKILLVINCLFLLIKGEIINNPKKISDHQYPFILQTSTEYFIYTSGENIIINKQTGEIVSIENFLTYDIPYVICRDESNNIYIYYNQKYYQIILPSSYTQIYSEFDVLLHEI